MDGPLGEEVDEADIRPSHEGVTALGESAAVVVLHLFQHVVDFVVVVESEGRLQGQNIGERLAQARAGEAAAVKLPDPHLADHSTFAALHAAWIDLQAHCAARLLSHLGIDVPQGGDPAAAVRGQGRHLEKPSLCTDRKCEQ